MRVAVVGAGIAGLSAAFRIVEGARRLARPVTLTVFEGADRLGGHATTIRDEGFLVETGPNAFLDRDGEHHALRLAEDAGAASELIEANPAVKHRFVVIGGRLRRAPDSPPGLIASDALT